VERRNDTETEPLSEHQSVEDIVAGEVPGLLAYFARRVSPAQDAADLVGETLLVLWRRSDAIPADHAAARMWVYGVWPEKSCPPIDRGALRRLALADKLRDQLLDQSSTVSHEDERVAYLSEALQNLKPVDQEIVRLVHWDRFTLAEVAELMGKRHSTVRSRYHRARAELKTRLTTTMNAAEAS
jgi:RNA polymerase sigma-70 factor (ECF subfamily)